MRKLTKILLVCDILVCLVILGMVMADKEALSQELIRLHVVAASDSAADQAVKLQVRNAVLESMDARLQQCCDTAEAKAYLTSCIPQLEETANMILEQAGVSDRATVTLCREEFPLREYDTFSLPSGVYESLRVTIGSGEGQNWWCVVFPSLCIPAAAQDTRSAAVSAGFSDHLAATLTGEEGYEISFFLLDCLGKLENLFHFG